MKNKVIAICIGCCLIIIFVEGIIVNLSSSEKVSNIESTISTTISSSQENTYDEVDKSQKETIHNEQQYMPPTESDFETATEVAVEYINNRYNYSGKLKKVKNDILKKIKSICDDNLYSKIKVELDLYSNNITSETKNKKIDKYCTDRDVYTNYIRYDDDSMSYIAICRCNSQTDMDYRRQLQITEIDGKLKVIDDKAIYVYFND